MATKVEIKEKIKGKMGMVFRGILLILAIVYTIFPVDLIPDALPVLGWLDDIGIDVVAIKVFINGLATSKAHEYVNTSISKAKENGDESLLKVADVSYAVASGYKTAKGSKKSEAETMSAEKSKDDNSSKEMNFF